MMIGSCGLAAWSSRDQFQAGQARQFQIGEHHVEGARCGAGQARRRRAWPTATS